MLIERGVRYPGEGIQYVDREGSATLEKGYNMLIERGIRYPGEGMQYVDRKRDPLLLRGDKIC